MEIRVGRNFRIISKLGKGSFGVIWKGQDVVTGLPVAIKLEHMKRNAPHLLNEIKINKILEGIDGVPRMHWYGCQGDYVVLVMDLCGPSLEDLFVACGRKLCLSTVSMLGTQIISRMESLHNMGVIHRDIKPHNFLMGRNTGSRTVYVIDFGLAKRYKDQSTGVHIPYKEGKLLTGTARFTSVSTHLGVEQSRRDDLESIGYMLLYLLRGSLPWQGLKAQNKTDKYERIAVKKMNTPWDVICKGLPDTLQHYMIYCRSLKFVERPDYAWLRDVLQSLFYHEPLIHDMLRNAKFNKTRPSDSSGIDLRLYLPEIMNDAKLDGVPEASDPLKVLINPPATDIVQDYLLDIPEANMMTDTVPTEGTGGPRTPKTVRSSSCQTETKQLMTTANSTMTAQGDKAVDDAIDGDMFEDGRNDDDQEMKNKQEQYMMRKKIIVQCLNYCREYEWIRRNRLHIKKQASVINVRQHAVGLPDPREIFDAYYAKEIYGGQR